MIRILVSVGITISLFITACAGPKVKTVDGSQREPVNKTVIQEQTGGKTNGK